VRASYLGPKKLRTFHFKRAPSEEILCLPVDEALATTFAERVSHQPPHAVPAKAAHLKSLGFNRQALELLTNLCLVNPDEMLFLRHLTETIESREDTQTCKHLLKAYLSRWLQDHWVWNLLGKTLQQLDETDNAQHAFCKAIELAPIQPWHHLDFLEFLRKQGDYSRALVHARKATELAPEQCWLHEKRADLALRSGMVDEARAAFTMACQMNPNAPWPHYHLAELCAHSGENAAALHHAQVAARLLPEQAAVQERLGNTALRAGALDTARAAFAEAARLDPHAPWPHYHLAELCAHSGENAAALHHAQVAARLLPECADVTARLAAIAFAAGSKRLAAAALSRTVQLEPNRSLDGYSPLLRIWVKGLSLARRIRLH
jgi:tetratricopeptide (TPR) repeat protein